MQYPVAHEDFMEPKYNLGWVVRQTGLSADTIRIWEKRYGIPHPQRTDGNQRLYSDHDVWLLNWLHEKTRQGVQISKAVSLWQEEARLMAAEQARNTLELAPPTDETERLRQSWVQACLNLDDQASTAVLDEAFSILSQPLAARQVVFAGVKSMETMWMNGEHSSHYLHYARQAASRKIYSLMGAYLANMQSQGILMLATVMEEEDPFRPVYMAYIAKMAGWKAVNAGPQMIAGPLMQTIRETSASALILVANHLHTAANAYQLLHEIQSELPVFYCGTFFELHPEIRERFPGVFLQEPWESQIIKIAGLLDQAFKYQGLPPCTDCADYLDKYQQIRLLVEQESQHAIPPAVLQDQHFAMANYFMQRGITAAMQLGQLSYLEEDLVWIHRLISNMGFGEQVMPAYVMTYRDAVTRLAGSELQPLEEALTNAANRMQNN